MSGPRDARRRHAGGPRVVIAGVSTRAAAASAARAGFDVTALDAYADRDQAPGVRALSLPRDFGIGFSATAAAQAAAAVPADAAAYLSNFENDCVAVAALGTGRILWGNVPEVLRRVRDPFTWTTALRARGLPVPNVRNANDANDSNDSNDSNVSWLVKPRASGGGQGVRPWRRGMRVPSRCYLQERIEGVPGATVFVAAAGRATVLGVSRQLIGEPSFGARAFRYCGSILAPPTDPQFARGDMLAAAAGRLAQEAAAALGLIGVNGIDFIARDGVPLPIEINPRWTASVELVELARDGSVFAAHAAACSTRDLPGPLAGAADRKETFGKAIVFARRAVTTGNTDVWLEDPEVRDVPHAGERIATGGPVCTVLARGADSKRCYEALVARANRIYDDLARWAKEAA